MKTNESGHYRPPKNSGGLDLEEDQHLPDLKQTLGGVPFVM